MQENQKTTHKGDQSKLLLLTALYVSLAANHHSSDSIARHRVLALLSFFSNSLNSRPVQPRQTQSSPGQPSQAQPSPAQPSTAQRSPARTFFVQEYTKKTYSGGPVLGTKFGPRTGPPIIFNRGRLIRNIIRGPVLGPNLGQFWNQIWYPELAPRIMFFWRFLGWFGLHCARLGWAGLGWGEECLAWLGWGWLS